MSEFIDDLSEKATDTINQSKDALLEGADQAKSGLEQTKDYVSANPVPIIAGALAIGFVLGYLIQREKPVPTLLESRIEELKDLVGSLKSRLSATAEDSYSDVSSALGGALKKAKKRFNLS